MKLVTTEPGRGEPCDAGPTRNRIVVPGSATEGQLSAVIMSIPAGWAGPPAHVHARIDHLWQVLDGTVLAHLPNDTVELRAGSTAFIPHGTTHGFSAPDGATVLQVDTPVALDGYFRELSRVLGTTGQPDPAAIGTIMRHHDTVPTTLAPTPSR